MKAIMLAAMLCSDSGSICLDSTQQGVHIQRIEQGECIKEPKGETCSMKIEEGPSPKFTIQDGSDAGEIIFVKDKWFMTLKWSTRTETKSFPDRETCDAALELEMTKASDNFINGYCRSSINRGF